MSVEMITLKDLCTELKLDARECRERLRLAARDPKKFPILATMHKPRTPWLWEKNSVGEKEARAVLSPEVLGSANTA